MAGSPEWKVYDRSGGYVAACKEPEAAGALMGLYGKGATIRWRHSHIVWREGSEECEGAESWDVVATTVRARVREIHERNFAAAYMP